MSSNPLPSVLVVDDERIVADTLAAILQSNGFDATPHYQGEDALRSARRTSPDAVVCDIMLGDVNGIEIAKQIVEMHAACRIILISGAYESAELLEHAGQEFVVLAKPFRPETLIDKLREICGLSTEAA